MRIMYGSEGLRDMREYQEELSDPPITRNGDGKLKCLEMLFDLIEYSYRLCDQV